jgi:ABC-type glycerol-3-phosphate transport system permease component
MTETINSTSRPVSTRRSFSGSLGQSYLWKGIATLLLAAGAAVIMIPFLYLLSTSVKDRDQMRQSDSRQWLLITREAGIPDTEGGQARWSRRPSRVRR